MQYAVRRLLAHRESGKLADDVIEARLERDDQEMLDQRIATTLWYPIDSYDRIMLLLREVEGGMGDEWWIQFGEEHAEELLLFRPVQVMLRGARGFGSRAGIALIKLSTLYFNFGTWSFDGEGLESFTAKVQDATPMSDPCRLIVLGFIRYLVRKFVGHDVTIVSERPSKDVIIYRTPD
jgi:hypothetical protein